MSGTDPDAQQTLKGAAKVPVEPKSRTTKAARGPADPVRTLMHRHRELCARAVDPLDIAAGLEAHGVTDRTAARFKHRDVFSLAEEMYARTQRAEPVPAESAAPPQLQPLVHLLPAGLALPAALIAVRLEGAAQGGLILAGAIAVAFALKYALRGSPLRAAASISAALSIAALAAYALYGDWLLDEAQAGATTLEQAPTVSAAALAALVALSAALVPAAAIGRWFTERSARHLAQSRDHAEFADRVRPLLLGAVAAALAALLALQLAAQALTTGGLPRPGILAAATALGILLFLARLLAVHGHGRQAANALATAAAFEAAAVLLSLSARLPFTGFAGRPAERLVAAYGLTAVPATICGAAALLTLAYAATALTRASAHRKEHFVMTATPQKAPAEGPTR